MPGGLIVARGRRTHPTLAGTFEASEGGLLCRLVVALDERGALHGRLVFGTLQLWLRGAHANRGRLGVGSLAGTRDGAPLAWVRLRTAGDGIELDLDAADGSGGDAGVRPGTVVFGRPAGEG